MSQGSLDTCAAYSEMVRSHDLVLGEIGYWENLLIGDDALRARRIADVRSLLRLLPDFGDHRIAVNGSEETVDVDVGPPFGE